MYIEPEENHGLPGSVLIRDLHQINTTTSDVQQKIFSFVERL